MRALVTGATGFIGNYLVKELRRLNWEVICLVRKPVKTENPGIRCVIGDLLQPDSLDDKKLQLGFLDTIFHLGAQLPDCSIADDTTYFRVNTLATVKLLQIADKSGADSFVYASSLAIIGKPETLPISEGHRVRVEHPYFASKLCGELICEMTRETGKRRIVSLRITSPYGPGMVQNTVLPRFIHQAIHSQALEWFGSGERRQNFVHVSDVVHACILAASTKNPGVYSIGGDGSVSMKELAELVSRLTPDCQSPVRAGGVPDAQEDYRWEVDLSHARKGLGYFPSISLKDGLAEYIKFRRSNASVSCWWRPES